MISGFGRLGEYFGVTRYGGAPDVITLAKGLTSGHVPMGAVMLSEGIVDVLREPGCTLMHGLTFGGPPGLRGRRAEVARDLRARGRPRGRPASDARPRAS